LDFVLKLPDFTEQDMALEAFLVKHELQQYVEDFTDHGFDNLEDIANLSGEEFERVGLLSGHAIKLVRVLKETSDPQVYCDTLTFSLT
jgi:hypothetical protein